MTDIRAAALAIAARDYHAARVPVPRLHAGELSTAANASRWRDLHPFLIARVTAMLRDNMADALVWRAIFGRIADNWMPQAQLTRALQQELNASGLFSSVDVSLELNPQVAGGGRWIAMQTKGALAELRRRLQRREACLVELIRDAEVDSPAVNLAVVYRLEDELNAGRDGIERVRLWVYDPRRSGTATSLRLTLADDRVQSVEMPATHDVPSVKAIRLVTLEPSTPPLLGWHRRLSRVLPWGPLWSMHRSWQRTRTGDRDVMPPPA